MKSIKNEIWSSSIQFIKIRAMSRSELRMKLNKKHSGENKLIEKVLNELEDIQLLNDKKYAEQLINHLIQRPIGQIKIYNDCRKRGLNTDLVQALLMNTNYSEEKMAEKALEQKLISLRESNLRKRNQKLMNFLKSRGFTSNVIYSVVSKNQD